MPDETEKYDTEGNDDDDHHVPTDLLELYEILEYQAAVEGKAS